MDLRIIKKNIREAGMYIALLFIMVFFTITTGGIFMSARNLSNLFDQTGYIAVLACGMTIVLILLQIDLSVGFIAGFTGALAAMLMMKFPHMPLGFVIILILGVGVLIGLYQGVLVARLGVPAFVVTLAGQFLFRGALLRVTEGTGTIVIKNELFNALGNGFIPDIDKNPHFHMLTMILGFLLVAVVVYSGIKARIQKKKYNLQVIPLDMFVERMIFGAALILFFSWKLASYHGLSWTLVIVLIVFVIYNFFTNNTTLGRHIYAVGGNPEAAELSGINSSNIVFFSMINTAVMAALAGILYTARLQSATTNAGLGFELDAIAAAFVGGTATTGGIGKITGTMIGALVISSLSNGMNLMNIGISYQYMVRGLVLVAAVLFDVQARRMKV
jgi:putative multiple sugar transport system permease protein